MRRRRPARGMRWIMNTTPSRAAAVGRWILATLIYLGIACILAALTAWLMDRFSPRSMAIGRMLASILALVLGAARLSALGISRDPAYQMGQSVSEGTLNRQVRSDFAEAFGGGHFMAQMAVVAVACIALSLLVEVSAK